MEKATKRVWWVISVGLVAAVLAGVLLMFGSMRASLDPVVTVDRYRQIRSEWQPDLVAHFPASADNVDVFYYQPPFLQGGASIQLRVQSTAAEIDTVVSNNATNVLATYHGGDTNAHMAIQRHSSTQAILAVVLFLTTTKSWF